MAVNRLPGLPLFCVKPEGDFGTVGALATAFVSGFQLQTAE